MIGEGSRKPSQLRDPFTNHQSLITFHGPSPTRPLLLITDSLFTDYSAPAPSAHHLTHRSPPLSYGPAAANVRSICQVSLKNVCGPSVATLPVTLPPSAL